MIVAAGLGTRLRPLTELRAKPALPVRGLPLVAYPLALLRSAGVREVVINVHHLPESLVAAAERFTPEGMRVFFSHERDLLHTGGAIRRVASFLRESEWSVVLGGDMVVDLDLPALIREHGTSGRAVTAVLADDPRAESFGTIGIDAAGRLRRVGRRPALGAEQRAGVYTWVNVLSARAFDSMPERDVFNHLEDWWLPWAAERPDDVGGVLLSRADCAWEPVGTPAEYLHANFALGRLSYFDADARARALGVALEPELVVGAGATVGAGARLARVVVWDGERVPGGLHAHDGAFAGARFVPCVEADAR
jgi:NDP-sugar pyrophosphorylase family protein